MFNVYSMIKSYVVQRCNYYQRLTVWYLQDFQSCSTWRDIPMTYGEPDRRIRWLWFLVASVQFSVGVLMIGYISNFEDNPSSQHRVQVALQAKGDVRFARWRRCSKINTNRVVRVIMSCYRETMGQKRASTAERMRLTGSASVTTRFVSEMPVKEFYESRRCSSGIKRLTHKVSKCSKESLWRKDKLMCVKWSMTSLTISVDDQRESPNIALSICRLCEKN
jgi:hypothetical protein